MGEERSEKGGARRDQEGQHTGFAWSAPSRNVKVMMFTGMDKEGGGRREEGGE
jgi:hypothetical protein